MRSEKNIVVIPMIIPKDKDLDKFGGWEWMLNSKKAWEYWCNKYGYELVIYDEPSLEDTTKYKITTQRWFDIFNFLDRKNIKYDQVAMVDASSFPKWNCPDFFKLTDNKFTVGLENDNLRWIYESVQGYKNIFNNYELDISKYFCTQFVIFNKSHKELFKKFEKFYKDNVDELVKLQTKTVKRGTDQTPFNYVMQMNNVDINYLPKPFRLSHLYRKEMLGHNWQLNEDTIPFFIKYGYVWFFSGFDKTQRDNLMRQVWELVKDRYDEDFFINNNNIIESKDVNKNATTLKFKKDIYNTFNKPHFKNMTLLELGCNHGNTTRVYAECFGKVIAVDMFEDNIKKTKSKCQDVNNVQFITADVYDNKFKLPEADVVHIDAGHTYQQVAYDIDRCIDQLDNPIFILDDYGNPKQEIKKVINDKVKQYQLKIDKFIGEKDGFVCTHGLAFNDREGVIINLK